jgi:hypothetical protein
MTASARPGGAEGVERADSHADTGRILECMVVQAEEGGIGDGAEPHAAWPGEDAVQEGAGPVSERKAHQLSMVGFVESAAYECGQLSELSGCWCGETSCRMQAIREAVVYVPPGHKCGSFGVCEGVQVGGGRTEYSGGSRGRGQKGRGADVEGKVGDAEAPVAQREMKL